MPIFLGRGWHLKDKNAFVFKGKYVRSKSGDGRASYTFLWLGLAGILCCCWLSGFSAAWAEASLSDGSSFGSSTAPMADAVLQALDPVRGIAVFNNAESGVDTVRKGQRLPGSQIRLVRVFPSSVELMQDDPSAPVSFFLNVGERLESGLQGAREARSVRHVQIRSVAGDTLSIESRGSLSNSLSVFPEE